MSNIINLLPVILVAVGDACCRTVLEGRKQAQGASLGGKFVLAAWRWSLFPHDD